MLNFLSIKFSKIKSLKSTKKKLHNPTSMHAWALLKRIMVTLKVFFRALHVLSLFAYYTLHETKNPSKV
jgi:hypothetical protein